VGPPAHDATFAATTERRPPREGQRRFSPFCALRVLRGHPAWVSARAPPAPKGRGLPSRSPIPLSLCPLCPLCLDPTQSSEKKAGLNAEITESAERCETSRTRCAVRGDDGASPSTRRLRRFSPFVFFVFFVAIRFGSARVPHPRPEVAGYLSRFSIPPSLCPLCPLCLDPTQSSEKKVGLNTEITESAERCEHSRTRCDVRGDDGASPSTRRLRRFSPLCALRVFRGHPVWVSARAPPAPGGRGLPYWSWTARTLARFIHPARSRHSAVFTRENAVFHCAPPCATARCCAARRDFFRAARASSDPRATRANRVARHAHDTAPRFSEEKFLARHRAPAPAPILPLKTREGSLNRCVKKLFRPNRVSPPHPVFPLKTASTTVFRRRDPREFSRQNLSNKKVRPFSGEKIDGPYPHTISSALGSGQPHPVVVSNV